MNKTTRKCLAVFVSAICVKYSIDAHKVIAYASENESQSAMQTQLTEGDIDENTTSVSNDQSIDSETSTVSSASEISSISSSNDNTADVSDTVEETIENSNTNESLSENSSEDTDAVSSSTTSSTSSLLEAVSAGDASVDIYDSLGFTSVNSYNLKFVNEQVANLKSAKGTDYVLTLDDVQTVIDQAFSLITYYYKCMANGTATLPMYLAADVGDVNVNTFGAVNRELVFKEKTSSDFDFNLSDAASGGLKDKVAEIVKMINDFPLNNGGAQYAINTEEAFGTNLDEKPGFEYVCKTDITAVDAALIRMNLGTATLYDYVNIVDIPNVNDYNLPFIQKEVVKKQLAENRKLSRDDIHGVVIGVINSINEAYTRINLGQASIEDYKTIGADWIGTLDLKEINPLMAGNVYGSESQFNGFTLQRVENIALNAASNEKYDDITSNTFSADNIKYLNSTIYKEAVKYTLSSISGKKPAGEYCNGGDLRKAIFDACELLNGIYTKINNGTATKTDYRLAGIDVTELLNNNSEKSDSDSEDTSKQWIDVSEINDYVKGKINYSELYKNNETYLNLKNLVETKINALKNVNNGTVEINYNYNNFKDHDLEYRCEFNNDYTILGLKNVDKYMIQLLKPEITYKKITDKKQYLSSSEIIELQDNLIKKLETSYKNILSGNATVDDYNAAGFDWISKLNIYEINERLSQLDDASKSSILNQFEAVKGITSSTENLCNDLIQENIDNNINKFTDVYSKLKESGFNNCYVELEKIIFHLAFTGAGDANDRLNEYNINVVKQQLSNNTSSIKLKKFGTTICETLDAIKKAYNDINSNTLPGNTDEQASAYNFTQLGWVYWANVEDVTSLLNNKVVKLVYGDDTEKTSIDTDIDLQQYYDVQSQVFKLAMALAAVNGGTACPADFAALGIDNINDYTVKIAKIRLAQNDPGDRFSISELSEQVADELANLLDAYKRMNAGTAAGSDYPFALLSNVFTVEDGNEALKGKVFSSSDDDAILKKDTLDYSDLTPEFSQAVNKKAMDLTIPSSNISCHTGTRNHYVAVGITTTDTTSDNYRDDYQLNVIDNAIAEYKQSSEFTTLNREHLWAELEREQAVAAFAKLKSFYTGKDENGNNINATDRFTVENFKFAGINNVNENNIDSIKEKLVFTSNSCTAADRTALQTAVNEIILDSSDVSDAEKEVMKFESIGIFNLDEYTVKYAKEDLEDLEITADNADTITYKVYCTLNNLNNKYLIINSGQATRDDYAAVGIDTSALNDDQLKELNENFNGKVTIDSIIRAYDCYRYNVVSKKNKLEIEDAISTILNETSADDTTDDITTDTIADITSDN